MQKANEEKAKYEMEDAALKAVSDNVEIDIPSGMIDAEIDNMMKDIEQRLQYQGLTLAQYFTLSGMVLLAIFISELFLQLKRKDRMLRQELYDYIENNMKVEKAIEFIVNNAKIK